MIYQREVERRRRRCLLWLFLSVRFVLVRSLVDWCRCEEKYRNVWRKMQVYVWLSECGAVLRVERSSRVALRCVLADQRGVIGCARQASGSRCTEVGALRFKSS